MTTHLRYTPLNAGFNRPARFDIMTEMLIPSRQVKRTFSVNAGQLHMQKLNRL